MGELIEISFAKSARSAPAAESPLLPEEATVYELSEEALIQTAVSRELNLIEANYQMVAGQISVEEHSDALAACMRLSDMLTEAQQIAVAAYAQTIYEHDEAP
jgi:hypothetical protein